MKNLKIFVLFSLSQFVILNNLQAFKPAHLRLARSRRETVLTGLDLRGGSFYKRIFTSKNFKGTNFGGANLRRATFENCNLDHVSFNRKADLRNSTFINCTGTQTSFKHARLKGATFINCTFEECCLSWACLINTSFNRVRFAGNLCLNHADLFNCTFHECAFQAVFHNETRNLDKVAFTAQMIIEFPQPHKYDK
jgi:uncharacterized protein YjbI with pentapeptide repeats